MSECAHTSIRIGQEVTWYEIYSTKIEYDEDEDQWYAITQDEVDSDCVGSNPDTARAWCRDCDERFDIEWEFGRDTFQFVTSPWAPVGIEMGD